MAKPKLLFVYNHAKPEWWQDGLSAALDLLEEDFEIERFNLAAEEEYQTFRDHENKPRWDFVLGWGAFGSEVDKYLQDTSGFKKGLCIAGNSFLPTGADYYDLLACETDWIKDVYLRGVTAKKVKAFGINTDLFNKVTLPMPIVWDYIGVGSLSNWKRWQKMIDKKGNRLVVGEFQEGNVGESQSIATTLLRSGIMVSNCVAPLDLVNFYHWSRTAYIPADIIGGGERSVLEARACGLNVEIEPDNPKLQELVDIDPIPSHHDYAKALKESILGVL